MSEKIHPHPGLRTYRADLDAKGYAAGSPSQCPDLDRANLLGSVTDGDIMIHKPVLDIDIPMQVIPSSTPGHYHLIFDVEIEHWAYFDLLESLADCGIVQRGWVRASEERGFSAVRLPWIKKQQPAEEAA